MLTKLIKVFGFFKSHGTKIILLATIVLAIIGGIENYRANKWEAEALRLDGKLKEQQADQDKLYGEAAKARAQRNVEKTEEAKVRKQLEASIAKERAEGLVAKRALAAEKKKTATLPPNELVAEINQRIGDQLTLTEASLYLFTRTGTERTLNRFKDGEFYLSEYGKYQKVLVAHDLEIAAFNTSIEQCEEAVIDNLMGWEDCRETLTTAMDDIAALKKTKQGGVWRGRLQGGAIAITFVALLKLLGTW